MSTHLFLIRCVWTCEPSVYPPNINHFLQMCSYKLIVSTPIVCSKYMEEKSFAELERLGVFGFSKTSSSGAKNER